MDGQQRQGSIDPREHGLGALAVLPDELICFLLAGLDVRELLALGQASRLLRVFACEEPLWLAKHLERCRTPFDYKGSWRATYLAHHPDCGRPELTAADLVPLTPVPGFSSPALYRRWYRCNVDLSGFAPPPAPPIVQGSDAACRSSGSITHVPDAAGMDPAEFEARFDGPGQPALLGGLATGWAGGSGLDAWQPDALAARFGDCLFRVTKPFFSGGRTRMRLADYLAYGRQQHDEEPLYIFDANFGEAAPELLNMYQAPPVFRHDLFACLGYRREDWRWLVAGPARSGASWHVDPSATSAWNTLLSGRKRWALYPPGRVPPGVEVAIDDDGHPDFQTPTSLQWFLEVYPQLPPEARPLEALQQPGDTIFVPAGWWHCVLNLDFTVAVTQNFVSPANLEAAVQWQALGAGSLFDPLLVPTYVAQQAQQEQQAQLQGVQQQGQQLPPQQQQQQQAEAAPPPAKRQRRGRQHAQRSVARQQPAGAPGTGQGHDEAASEEERAAAQAAAEEHLEGLTLGFSRDSFLGPWLRRLLQQLAEPQQPAAAGQRQPQQQPQQQQPQQKQQHLAERVWALVQQWSDLERWRPRLEQVCLAAGLPPPQARYDWLPLATGWCVVFEVSGVIFKFYNSAHAPHAPAMAAIEAAAYLAQAAAAGSRSKNGKDSGGGNGGASGVGSGAPALLGAGVLQGWKEGGLSQAREAAAAEHEPAAPAAAVQQAAAPPPPLPFLAIRKAEGVTLGSCMDSLSKQQWLVVAAAAGLSLAAFHSMPLPAVSTLTDACCGCNGASADVVTSGSGGSAACTAWVARDGLVYSSTAGTLDMRGKEDASAEHAAAALDQRQQQCLQLFPCAAAVLGQRGPGGKCSLPSVRVTSTVAELADTPDIPAANGSMSASKANKRCGACRAWQPFLLFLRRQRRHAAKVHRREGSLPPQLQQQVDSYLPADPAVLVGHGGCACCGDGAEGAAAGGSPAAACTVDSGRGGSSCDGSACGGGGRLPVWVHGDLTAENLLLSTTLLASESQQSAQMQPPCLGGSSCTSDGGVTLIDFADSGHGDPLWDFVPLLLRSFRCSQAAADACFAAYCAALPAREAAGSAAQVAGTVASERAGAAAAAAVPEANSKQLPDCWPARPPGISLSYVAMCYALLHELGPVHDVFKRRPHLWGAASLEAVQWELFGWLDAFN